MASQVQDEDLQLQSVQNTKKKWFYMQPRLNYKSGPLSAFPPTINPKNWTPITQEELKAHQERQAIRGRTRREMWVKAYHPDYYKNFNQVTSDKHFIRFGRLKSVWHIKDAVHGSSKAAWRGFCIGFVFPGAIAYLIYKYNGPDRRTIFEYENLN